MLIVLHEVQNKHKLGTMWLSIGNGIYEPIVLPPYSAALYTDQWWKLVGPICIDPEGCPWYIAKVEKQIEER